MTRRRIRGPLILRRGTVGPPGARVARRPMLPARCGRPSSRCCCGGSARRLRHRARARRESQDATLVLDFTPNAIHAGIYSGDRADLRPGRGRQPARRRAVGEHRLDQAARDRPRRTSRSSTSTISRSPASATRTSSGSWRSSSGRWPSVIAAPADPQSAPARGQDGRRHRRAERHRGAATRSSAAPAATRRR